MTPYPIILAARPSAFREGMRRIIEEQPDLTVMGEAGEGLALLSLVRFAAPGDMMVILDVSLPNIPWTEAIRKIKADRPDTRILLLSMYEDAEYVSQALATGADGYLIKKNICGELLPAIGMIKEGQSYVPPDPYCRGGGAGAGTPLLCFAWG